ncbi:hypothetical protein [Foliimonas ilicis]
MKLYEAIRDKNLSLLKRFGRPNSKAAERYLSIIVTGQSDGAAKA